MKIVPEHLEHMRREIARVATPENILAYESGNFPRASACSDLQTRFNFDLLVAAGLTPWICKNVYPYANDDHLASALRSICPKINRKF